MTSGSVVVQVLEANNAVDKYREIMGATNPEKAKNGTIRKKQTNCKETEKKIQRKDQKDKVYWR